MSVFVTGATGVLGRSVVTLLVDSGYSVRGLARSQENVNLLRSLGAEPVQVDLYDVAALKQALAGCHTILHLATRIPPSDKMRQPVAWEENDRIRRDGTRSLVDAALATDVATLVYPGVVLPYPDSGDAWIDSATPVQPALFLHSTLQAEAEVERFARAGRRGISLRMGQFIGPESSQTSEALKMAKSGFAAMLGSDGAYQSSIWVADAARAVIAAMQAAPPGVFDVVDDEPLRRTELLEAMAAAAGRKRLFRLPAFIVRWVIGPEVASVGVRSQRVTNHRFKEATGWAPQVRSAREAWQHVSAAPQ